MVCSVRGVLEGSGEEDAALLVGGGFEGVVGRGGVGEGLEDGCGGERVVPGGVLHEGVGGEGAGGICFGEDEGAEEDAFDLAGGVGAVGADAFSCGWRRLV